MRQVVHPPMYPFLLGAADRILHDPVLSGRLISLLASAASIVIFYLLARALFGMRAAIIAALAWALLPARATTSVLVLSDSTLLALTLGGILLWLASSGSLMLGLVCGVVFGGAYLTHPQGLLFFGILALGAVLAARARGQGRLYGRLGSAVIGFAASLGSVHRLPAFLYGAVGTVRQDENDLGHGRVRLLNNGPRDGRYGGGSSRASIR